MKKEERKGLPNLVLVIGVIAVLALIGGVGAKYAIDFSSGLGRVTADKFYFTTDLLGDQTMVPSTGENSASYQYEDVQSGEWHLYGGEKHEISFQVRNYADEARVTQAAITYTAKVAAAGKDGKPINGLAAIQKEGETAQATDLTATLTANGKATDKWTLSIRSAKGVPYQEGTEVVVTITSEQPYQKTMEFHFKLYTVDTYLSYEVKDSVDSPYAELFIMTNIVDQTGATGSGGVQPTLVWPQELYIDNTNNLAHGENFAPLDGMEDRRMKISQPLKAGESESIYFFKSNPKANYSKERTTVEPTDKGEYTITLGEHTIHLSD